MTNLLVDKSAKRRISFKEWLEENDFLVAMNEGSTGDQTHPLGNESCPGGKPFPTSKPSKES